MNICLVVDVAVLPRGPDALLASSRGSLVKGGNENGILGTRRVPYKSDIQTSDYLVPSA